MPSGLSIGSWTGLTCDTTPSPPTPSPAECVGWGLQALTNAPFTISVSFTSATQPNLLPLWIFDNGGLSSVSAINQVACTGPGTSGVECFATGLNTASPAAPILLNLPSGSSSWATNTGLPSGFAPTSYAQLTCSSAACFSYGQIAGGAFVLSLGSPTGTPAWTSDTLASTLFVSGFSCVGITSTCEATGANSAGAQLLDYLSSTTTFSLDSASGTLVGAYQAALPVSVFNSSIQPQSTLEMYAPPSGTPLADTSLIGPLFPYSSYAVGAGDCAADVANASVITPQLHPGDVAAAAPTVTLPMGLVPIQVVDSTGKPVAGATVSAVLNDAGCSALVPLNGGVNPASWAFTTSGLDGVSRLAVIYETYTVTVTAPGVGGAHAAAVIQVTPTSVTNVTNGTTSPLPLPVQVTD
jgi:hypothetical protein